MNRELDSKLLVYDEVWKDKWEGMQCAVEIMIAILNQEDHCTVLVIVCCSVYEQEDRDKMNLDEQMKK